MTEPLFLIDDDRLVAAECGDIAVLDGPEGRHAAKVRRLGVGERLALADGAGLVWSGEVAAVVGDQLRVRLMTRAQIGRPQPSIVVVQALAKGDRDERAVETMTEVGVDGIVPWAASRCIVRWDADRAAKGVAKWRLVAREATKQARRGWLPEVAELMGTGLVVDRLRAARAHGGLGVVLHESAQLPLAGLVLPETGEIVVVVGPEGGISEDELASFSDVGAIVCRLGPSVLRTSTAGTVAAAVLCAQTGRWN